MYQRVAPLGYQQITSLGTAVGLTLPLGAQQAQATACSLAGAILTVGGTVTGTFAIGQTVTGTGILANTSILRQLTSATWLLSQACTTESSETVTAYAPTGVNFAVIGCTGANVVWRDDGTAPTASVGMPMLATSPLFEYGGPLATILFIAASGSPVLNISYYSLSGGS